MDPSVTAKSETPTTTVGGAFPTERTAVTTLPRARVVVAEVAPRDKTDLEPARRWMAIAVTSWFLFLFLEVVEWVHLVYVEQLGPYTQFGSVFLALTGFHYLAATCCMVWLGIAAARVEKRDLLAPALYSHLLNLWWIVIVVTVYFPNADLRGI